MSECWVIYRHRNRPEVRYYVEMHEGADGGLRANIRHVVQGTDKYQYKERLVRLKSVKNAAYDKEDHPPWRAAEAGLWPVETFLNLYEKEGLPTSA